MRDNNGRFLKGEKSLRKGVKLSEKIKKKISKGLKGNIPWNKGKKCKQLSGKNHWKYNKNFEIEKRKYLENHKWIINKLGNENNCEHCKRTDRKRYDWSNKDHKYKRLLKDWQRLCRSCHLKYDFKYNNFNNFIKKI